MSAVIDHVVRRMVEGRLNKQLANAIIDRLRSKEKAR